MLNVSAGSECGTSICIWGQISQVRTGTSALLFEFSPFYLMVCTCSSCVFWWTGFELCTNILQIIQWLILCSNTCSPGEAWHWSCWADIFSADSQHGPSGRQWHKPVSGGYPGLHLWNSTPKKWRQGGGKRLPDVCHWFTVRYVRE